MNELVKTDLNKGQIELIKQITPKEFVKQRPGRGSKIFDYVEIGYIIDQLNIIFGFLGWDIESELIETLTTPNFLTVNTKLTIKDHLGHQVIKTAFGGVERKRSTKDGTYVDIADDAKAAEADGLKKCASKLGIAADIYYPELQKDKIVAEKTASVKCENCTNMLTKAQADYSKKIYKKVICKACQLKEKDKK